MLGGERLAVLRGAVDDGSELLTGRDAAVEVGHRVEPDGRDDGPAALVRGDGGDVVEEVEVEAGVEAGGRGLPGRPEAG
jgi:hypothetical protein